MVSTINIPCCVPMMNSFIDSASYRTHFLWLQLAEMSQIKMVRCKFKRVRDMGGGGEGEEG